MVDVGPVEILKLTPIKHQDNNSRLPIAKVPEEVGLSIANLVHFFFINGARIGRAHVERLHAVLGPCIGDWLVGLDNVLFKSSLYDL